MEKKTKLSSDYQKALAEIDGLKHLIALQREQFKAEMKAKDNITEKYKDELAHCKAYIKALVNRNIFERITNKCPDDIRP